MLFMTDNIHWELSRGTLSLGQTRKHCCGNIICFLSMYPCLPTSGNIVAEAKFASQEENIFSNKFRNIFVAETMFRTWFHLFW